MFAQIVLGIPVEGPFDYSIPEALAAEVKPGSRVEVNFSFRRSVGFVVAVSSRSKVAKTKPIVMVLEPYPIISEELLSLALELSRNYCCSWGEAIETAIPQKLRTRKPVVLSEIKASPVAPSARREALLIHDPSKELRWEVYQKQIKKTIEEGRCVIFLCPDIRSISASRVLIEEKTGIKPVVLDRADKLEAEVWLKIKQSGPSVVIGTRSCVFAPCANLGLIIVDEEHEYAYKQDQVPHYNAREVAVIRSKRQGCSIILCSSAPSMESYYQAQSGELEYTMLSAAAYPKVELVDMSGQFYLRNKNIFLSPYLQDCISRTLGEKKKAILFINRKGFATFAFCHSCGAVFKCPRCNVNLVYHFKEDVLSCHYCSYRLPSPQKICASCNSGYIKYKGLGVEKIESEVSRIFPQVKVRLMDKGDLSETDADICISTQAPLRYVRRKFALSAVLLADDLLNHSDLRSGERAFAVLTGLAGLTEERLVIQTRLMNHYCFLAIKENKPELFYKEELKERKGFSFPPYKHLAAVKFRGKDEERVKAASSGFLGIIKKTALPKTVKPLSVNPAAHLQLRGSFHWQVLLLGSSREKLCEFIKKHLKDFRHSGIIVTVDVDPV